MTLFALLGGTALFVAATGLLGTALALRADAIGFSDTITGAVMSAYFLGFMIGTFLCPRIVAQSGHIRSFAAFAALAAVAVLMHAVLFDPWIWAILRFTSGVCVVGLYMIVESWLNEKASNQSRGRLFAVYQIISLVSLALGQWLLLLDDIISATPFLIGSALFSLGLIPIALTRVAEPTPIPIAKLDLRHLWSVSPLGVIGTFVAAMANGIFFALGPLFAQSAGMDVGAVALFMSLVILGGVALQWPLGHFSDTRDRRSVILAASLGAAITAGLAAFMPWISTVAFYCVAFLYGGFTFSLYPLCVAHSNDQVPAHDLMRTASGLLLIYGAGATLGPLLMGWLMDTLAPGIFFVLLMATHLVLGLYTSFRMGIRPAAPTSGKEPFVMLSRTSQSALEMLPSAVANEADAEDRLP
jgi:MFS family permease